MTTQLIVLCCAFFVLFCLFPILQGFEDKRLNKRIMFRNMGDVKGTVKELVHLYREKEAGQ